MTHRKSLFLFLWSLCALGGILFFPHVTEARRKRKPRPSPAIRSVQITWEFLLGQQMLVLHDTLGTL
ncbi:MAG: hypothetical protein AAGJ35_02075, partial [Myxococcota bacterium]